MTHFTHYDYQVLHDVNRLVEFSGLQNGLTMDFLS